MNQRRRFAAAMAAAACLMTAGHAQEPAAPVKHDARPFEGAPTGVHLVGHEEADLLRRIQDLIDDFDPRKLVNPYVVTAEAADSADPKRRVVTKSLRRGDLAEFIADADAVEALGKAFFWEMQAGSDFRRQTGPDGKALYIGTACASCHYRFGADPRDTNTVRIPYVAWDRYKLDPKHPDLGYGETQQPVDAADVASRRVKGRHDLLEKSARGFPPPSRRGAAGLDADDEDDDEDDDRPRTPLSLIVGSQGVEPRVFQRLTAVGNLPDTKEGTWWSEHSAPRDPTGFSQFPQWAMFLQDRDLKKQAFRQITPRNAPTVINAAFADRLFHDARAESTFNGFSIFGDFDPLEVIHVRSIGPDGKARSPVPVRIALPRAALASQSVGPIVNDVEMSYVGRTFHDLAAKLLDAPILGHQEVSSRDSSLAKYLYQKDERVCLKYRDLIKRAFRREWWDGTNETGEEQQVELRLSIVDPGVKLPTGSLMEANFSLYWGLSLMLYQAMLISNESPYDHMIRGRADRVEELWAKVRARLEPIHLDRVHNPARRPTCCQPGEKPPATKPGEKPACVEEPAPDPPPFAFKSGSEVFQRGLRAFLQRGCADCHDGPLFSEVFIRGEAEFGELKMLPIGRQVRNALLPNSRADALAFRYVGARGRVLDEVSGLLKGLGKPKFSEIPSVRELLDYDDVFQRLGGQQSKLAEAVAGMLRASRLARVDGETPEQTEAREKLIAERSAKIAESWTTFEKTVVRRMGNRPFFGEDNRVALAGLIATPLLIEGMAIPPAFVPFRTPLPISGPKAGSPYAFYDTSVYNIAVSLPRYDGGEGGTTSIIRPPIPQADQDAFARDYTSFLDSIPAGIDPAALEDRMRAFDKESHRKYRLILSKEMRREVRGLARSGADAKKRIVDAGSRLAKEAAARASAAGGQASSGAPGSAYRLDRSRASVARNRARDETSKEKLVPGYRDSVYGPWDQPADADAEARASNPRDFSWYRNLPIWDRADEIREGQDGFDSVDGRRADVHFFARSRALVQDESPEGRRKPFLHDDELAFWGSFKTPSLRNVALTPPYMHNGRLQTLFDVLDFYDRGGDVRPDRTLNPDVAPAIVRLGMPEEDKLAVVFFLMCLSDPRVEYEKAPFDHPALAVVNGYEEKGTPLPEKTILIGAVGAGGRHGVPFTFPNGDDAEHPWP